MSWLTRPCSNKLLCSKHASKKALHHQNNPLPESAQHAPLAAKFLPRSPCDRPLKGSNILSSKSSLFPLGSKTGKATNKPRGSSIFVITITRSCGWRNELPNQRTNAISGVKLIKQSKPNRRDYKRISSKPPNATS